MVETIVIVVICCIVAVVALSFASAILKRRKKQKASAKAAQKAEPSGESKPQEAESHEPEQFKITKKARLSRISRKALKSDSRTVGTPTIEPVYARTPDAPEASGEVVVDQHLSVESEQFLQAVGGANTDGRQVVSLGELKKEQLAASTGEQASQANGEPQEEAWSSGQGLKKDLWSSMNARDLNISPIVNDDFYGHFTGNYTGIKVGAEVKQPVETRKDQKPKQPTDSNFTPVPPTAGWQDLSGGVAPLCDGFMGSSPFFGDSPFGRPVMPSQTASSKKQKFDLGEAVVAEAILNRKGKPLKKDKPDK